MRVAECEITISTTAGRRTGVYGLATTCSTGTMRTLRRTASARLGALQRAGA